MSDALKDYEAELTLAAQRAERFQRICEGYEVYDDGMPDATVPGVDRPKKTGDIFRYHPRFVLVTQYGDKDNYRLHLCFDRPNVEEVAAYLVTDVYGSENPICYFDLDQLAGDEPSIYEGDLVRYEGNQHRVNHVEEELIEGEVARYLCLVDAGHESGSWDDYDHRVHEDDIEEVIERSWPDERMPVRYGVAKITTHVVFNTTASPA